MNETLDHEQTSTSGRLVAPLCLVGVIVAALLVPPFAPLIAAVLAFTVLRGQRAWQITVLAVSVLIPFLGWLGLQRAV